MATTASRCSPSTAGCGRSGGRNGGDGSAGTGPGEFDQPRSASTDRAGNVYVVEKVNHRVQKLTPTGRPITRWGKNGAAGGGDAAIGSGQGEFNLPYDGAVDSRGRVYIVDTSNTRIQVFHTNGTFRRMWGTPGTGPGQFHDPYQVAIDCRDNVYVTDEDNSRVQVFGNPTAPGPRCAPAAHVQHPAWSPRRRAVIVRAECDQACTLSAEGSIILASGERVRLGSARARFAAEAPALLVLRPAGEPAKRIATALRTDAAVVARTETTASGFGGRSRAVHRQARLRR